MINEHESLMIKQLKTHMLNKLKTRCTGSQKDYLSCCSYLDPRFKNCVNFDMASLKKNQEINESYTEVILTHNPKH